MKTKNLLPVVLLFCLFMLLSYSAFANNIIISNVLLTEQVSGSHTMVQFDISWENSWRNDIAGTGYTEPYNYDAAWVFVKYKGVSGEWQHAWLNTTNGNHTAPSGSEIKIGVTNISGTYRGIGAFFQRSENETGNFSKTGVQLRWEYIANGVLDGATVDIQVFAIEMVYVPLGSFTVGDGVSANTFCKANDVTSPYETFTIGATAPTLAGNHSSSSPSRLSARGNWDLIPGATANLATGFPTGYDDFYCMKYEIMQQQYVDFLNSLTTTQASNRYSSGNPGGRYGITVTSGVYSNTTTQYVACNYLSWADLAAYLDWSGLRPMTELEFEKSCRGTGPAVQNECACGAIDATKATGILNGGFYNETASNSGANVCYDYGITSGPMRVGAFATATSTRVTSGATYYGIMEMSGNLEERTVTVGNSTGRAFTGTHGNGLLDPATGDADITYWPGIDAIGTGYRGGDWLYYYSYLCVSDRYGGADAYAVRKDNFGGRGVRTAP